MLKKRLFLLCCLLLSAAPLGAQPDPAPLARADSAFVKGAYLPAYRQYRQVLRAQVAASSRMLLRMAYVQEGLGHYPAALYYLSVLHARQPRLATWRKMTDLARNHRLAGYPDSWRQDLQVAYRRYYYTGLQLLLLGAVVGAVLLWARRQRLGRGWWLGYGGYVLAVGVYLHLLGAEQVVLVASPRAALMAGPSAGAPWLTTAAAGDRLLVQGHQDTWLRVQWQGQDAFIRRQDVLPVK